MNLTLLFPAASACGFLLDLVIGDPRWLPHPVRGMGWAITAGERWLRRVLPERERLAGAVLAVTLVLLTVVFTGAVVWVAFWAHRWMGFAVCVLISWQCIAARDLAVAALTVRRALYDGDLCAARRAVSMIVGRDTDALD
ncbi:MAG: cobalamin biosynthesis protein, partial [Propionibacteriaceae bacterium]|nr:cobalamin biosynthesis protein [Propionibacteriaceae bacterium]